MKKIADAIFKAARAIGGEDRQLAEELALVVTHYLAKTKGPGIPTVEEVQDAVEKVLIETGHARTAKAYILYRDWRTRLRETKSELMDAVEEILIETNRENANIGNSPPPRCCRLLPRPVKGITSTGCSRRSFPRRTRKGICTSMTWIFTGRP